MKTRRTKLQLGDVFLAPFEFRNAKYSTIWDSEWLPKSGEKCFAIQIVGKCHYSGEIVALFDGVYAYDDTDSLDISARKVLAIIELAPRSLAIGEFKRISNQPIPDDMPYMAYEIYSLGERYICPASNANYMIRSDGEKDSLPQFGFSATGGIMYKLAKWLILGELPPSRTEENMKEDLDYVQIRPGAEVWRYFPEAKNRDWILAQMSSTGGPSPEIDV